MVQLQSFAHRFKKWLNQPGQVFVISLSLVIITLFFNGTLWKLWSLYRDEERLQNLTLNAKSEIIRVDLQIKQAKDPVYIERQARDKMDLVGDHDLIFVFPE